MVIFTLSSMGETPEKQDQAPEAPKQKERKEKAPAAPRKGVPIDEASPEKEPGKEEKPKAVALETKDTAGTYDLAGKLTELENMSNEELMNSLFSQLGEIIKMFAEEDALEKLFGLGGPKFTPKQIEEVTIDVEAAEQKEYAEESTNKAVEFVCNALNLPVKKNVTALWYSLRSAEGVVYEQNKNMFKEGEVRVGDVLFFSKEGETQPYLTAIVSDEGPPMRMKYMEDSGEIREEEIIGSSLFDTEWFGFMKIPEQQKPEENPTP